MLLAEEDDDDDARDSQQQQQQQQEEQEEEDEKAANNDPQIETEIEIEIGDETAAAPAAQRLQNSAKCDVCGYGDGHNSLVLIECRDCQVHVHRDCYGMPTYIRRTFQCWACEAKGRTFHVHDADTGKRIAITQTERPRHCDLCGYNPPSHNTGNASTETEVHAMHPIYDNYGNKARQLFTTTDSDNNDNGTTSPVHRLVWAHTICGFFLATRHLLYATTKEGTTHEGDESDPEDDRSVNSELDDDDDDDDNDHDGIHDDHSDNQETSSKDDSYQGFAPSHHFVWHHERKWTQLVKEHQLALTCDICHQSDYCSTKTSKAKSKSKKDHQQHPQRIFRIAVQCTANDKSEYRLFRSTHTKSLQDNESCTMAYHVGCARWGGNNCHDNDGCAPGDKNHTGTKKSLRQVYYFPGLPDDDSLEPIQCLYCPVHARDVNTRESQQRQLEEESESRLARKKRKLAMIQKQGLACLTVDRYSVHKSTADQQEVLVDEDGDDDDDDDDDGLSLLERMKRDLAAKVVSVTRENSNQFIKEQKKLWQRLALASTEQDGAEEEELFPSLWKQAKAHANQVWQEHQHQRQQEQQQQQKQQQEANKT